jgi:hypothetical protein
MFININIKFFNTIKREKVTKIFMHALWKLLSLFRPDM